MSSKKTSKLNLHAWEAADPFIRTEFNENFEALDQFAEKTWDEVMKKADADTVTALQSALEGKADKTELDAKADSSTVAELAQYGAKIFAGSYPGKGGVGQSNPTEITLPFTPKLFIFYYVDYSMNPYFLIWDHTSQLPWGTTNNKVSYSGSKISWYNPSSDKNPQMQYNELGKTYYYFAIG